MSPVAVSRQVRLFAYVSSFVRASMIVQMGIECREGSGTLAISHGDLDLRASVRGSAVNAAYPLVEVYLPYAI